MNASCPLDWQFPFDSMPGLTEREWREIITAETAWRAAFPRMIRVLEELRGAVDRAAAVRVGDQITDLFSEGVYAGWSASEALRRVRSSPPSLDEVEHHFCRVTSVARRMVLIDEKEAELLTNVVRQKQLQERYALLGCALDWKKGEWKGN